MPINNIIECSNIIQKHQEVYDNTIKMKLLNANHVIIDFPADNITVLRLNLKQI